MRLIPRIKNDIENGVNSTFESDENNRVQKCKKDLENEIRSTWLERRDGNQTLEGDEKELVQDIATNEYPENIKYQVDILPR